MVTKTRERLIEVARQLFARKGIENTTMNDIAEASDKGRRTIYTYFRNKREIYNAVVEHESEQLVARLREVVESSLPPVEKLRKYLKVRIQVVDDATGRRSDNAFLSIFSRDFRRIDRIRRMAIAKETELFGRVIDEGVAVGVFDPAQASRAGVMETVVFQGIDYSHLRNNFSEINILPADLHSHVVDFMVDGIVNQKDNNSASHETT